MNLLIPKLTVLAVGVVSLMAGILLNREHGQSIRGALADSIVWGAGFFASFSIEFWLLAGVD